MTIPSEDRKLSADRLWALFETFRRFENRGREDDLLHLELYSDGSGGIIDSDDFGDPVTLVSWSTLAEAPGIIREADATVNAKAKRVRAGGTEP